MSRRWGSVMGVSTTQCSQHFGVGLVNHEQLVRVVDDRLARIRYVFVRLEGVCAIEPETQRPRDTPNGAHVPDGGLTGAQQCRADFTLPQAGHGDADAATGDLKVLEGPVLASQGTASHRVLLRTFSQEQVLITEGSARVSGE